MSDAPRPLVRRGLELPRHAGRRPGFEETRLLGPAESPHQNVVVVAAAPGAEVELHPVANSESLLVLEGEVEVFAAGFAERLGPGDLVHFAPGTAHGMRVVAGPARYLVIFAPARG